MNYREVPDFAKYEGLVSNLIQGTCIFVGAGISKLAGYPLWKDLADQLVEVFWQKRSNTKSSAKLDYSTKLVLNNHKDSIEVMDYLHWLNKHLFTESVGEIFREAKTREDPSIYARFAPLSQIRNSFFVQTNIDSGLQRGLNIHPSDISISPNFADPPQKLTYLHGIIDKPETWIFTRKDYDRNYLAEYSQIMGFLTKIFERLSVLFVGYSLSDFEVLQAMAKAGLRYKLKTHYWLVSFYREKEPRLLVDETFLKRNYGIQLIPYGIENRGYEALHEVMDALNSAIEARRA